MNHRTDTRLIPVIDGDVVHPDDTTEIGFPWAKPTVTRYTRRTWARRWATFRRSRFATDLARGWRRFAVITAFLAGFLILGPMLGGLIARIVL